MQGCLLGVLAILVGLDLIIMVAVVVVATLSGHPDLWMNAPMTIVALSLPIILIAGLVAALIDFKASI